MPRRAYSYIRFSSKKQAKGDSLRRQTMFRDRTVKKYQAALDDTLSGVDFGMPAYRSQNRREGGRRKPVLAYFLAAVESGRVRPGSVLIIEALDRLSRDQVGVQLQLFVALLNAGVVIVTAIPEREYTQASINDLAGLLEPIVYMARGHDESATKARRLREKWLARKAAARDGKKFGGVLPAWVRRAGDGYDLDPERAAVVRLIYRLAVEGLGAQRIAAWLEGRRRQYPVLGRSGHWSPAYVRLILRSRATLGEHQPREKVAEGQYRPEGEPIRGYYPAVVTEEVWYAAQAALTRRRGKSGRPGEGEKKLFTGLVRDARTGARLQLHPKGTRVGRRHKGYDYLAPPKGQGGGGVAYQPFEACLRRTLAELNARFVIPDGADRKREERIEQLTRKKTSLRAKMEHLQAQMAAADPDGYEALGAVLQAVAAQHGAAARELKALQEESATGRAEELGEAKSLLRQEADATGEERTELRRRLKARVANLIEEVWVLRQDVRRDRRIVHLQIYLRGASRPLYAAYGPPDLGGAEPWDVRHCDFRAGELGGHVVRQAAQAEAAAELVGQA